MESNATSDFGKAMASEEEERSTLLGALGEPEGPYVENAVVSGSNSGSGDGVVDIVVDIPTTSHEISQDSWLQVGFVLTTGVNSAYVLAYPGTIMVPLGWIGGVIELLFATVISLYASALVAKIHEFGGRRHIRYRDPAGFIYGRQAYNLTWALQYVNLYMFNVGFIILAGNSLKTNLTQCSGGSLPLQEVSSMLLDKLVAAGIGN